MKNINLKEILHKHETWLLDKEGGERGRSRTAEGSR